jgi:DNA polymerase I-like protein with 3'-5' exonuclease and polymerase domains
MASSPGCEVWAVDSEWGFHDGRVDHESAWEPVALCLVGLRSGKRASFWGRDPALRDFLRDHADDLFVAHYAVAEMKCLLRHGVALPARWFDTFVAWRYLTNRPGHLEAGLAEALVQLGLPGLAPAQKKELQQKLLHLQFDPNDPADRREILDYCFSDCDACAALHGHLLGRVPPEVMAHWAEYLKAVARMELRGIPFDVAGYARIRDLRPVVRSRLIGDANATWPVFEGESFKKGSFLRWCRKAGISWPTKVSERTGGPYHCVDRDTMKEMEWRHPFIAQVREVLKTLKQFEGRSLAVDPHRGRHYYSTSVFRSVTGRNQPRNFVFGGPKWLRFLIVPESPDHVLAYVDFVAQEVGIAAALSRDPAMRSVYQASDCHMEFAVRAGAAPAGAAKGTHPGVRKKYKTVNIGVLYGQTSYGIAARLGVSYQEAEAILHDHRALFPAFWRWSDRVVQGAYDRGWIKTPCGWRSLVPFPGNERTWMNWPMQATGGDVMRLTVTYLDCQNVRILAPVHDGFLLSCRRDQLDDLRAAVDFACGTAVEQVLPGFPLRWDFTVYDRGRFEDEDGRPLWEKLQVILEEPHGHEVAK